MSLAHPSAHWLTEMLVPTPFARPGGTLARSVAWFQIQIGTYAAFLAAAKSTGSTPASIARSLIASIAARHRMPASVECVHERGYEEAWERKNTR